MILQRDSVFEGTFERDGVIRAVSSHYSLANGEGRVEFNEWKDIERRAPTRGALSEEDWRRWVAWADRHGDAPRAAAPTFVDCPECAFRVERAAGFGPGDEVGCPECKTVFTVIVEAVAAGKRK